MKNYSVFIFILLSVYSQSVFCQYFFSQFYASPLTVNAANTGDFIGNYRMGGAYRNEKTAVALRSKGSFFFDKQILQSITAEGDKVAIGIIGLSEKSRTDGSINTNYGSASLAYHKLLDEEGQTQISMGFQAALANQRANFPIYIFESDIPTWLNSGFTGIESNSGKQINFSYLDMNLGLSYQSLFNQKNIFSLGLSIYHFNHPVKFYNGGKFDQVPIGGLQAKWETNVDEKHKWIYSGLLTYSKKENIRNIFANVRYRTPLVNSNYNFELGGGVRRTDLEGNSITPMLSLLYNNFSLGMAYDINVSRKTTSQRSALEMTLIYVGQPKRK